MKDVDEGAEDEEGGSGVATFFIVVLILGGVGGAVYYFMKKRDQYSGLTFAYGGTQSNIDPDGLTGGKAGDRVLPAAPTHDVKPTGNND